MQQYTDMRDQILVRSILLSNNLAKSYSFLKGNINIPPSPSEKAEPCTRTVLKPRLSERFFHDSGKLVGIHAYLVRILPFNHNPAQRFRARITQQHTPTAFKAFFDTGDGIGDFRVFLKRYLVFDVHVPEFLRIGDEQAGEFRQRPPPLAHDPQDLKSGKETVAGCAVFTENKMAGLLPAKESPLLAHGRHDMAIAYVGTDKRTAPLLHEHFKRHVAHDRGHKDVAWKLALLHEILSAQGHDLVAIQNGALFVHDDEAIGIAVQSKPNIGPRLADLRGHSLGVQGTAAVIDIQPVGLRTDFNDFGAQLLKGQRRDPIVGAIGAVNDHPQPFKGQVRGETVFEIHDVTARASLIL